MFLLHSINHLILFKGTVPKALAAGETPLDKLQLRIMTSIINRIIELAGWIVLGVSVILLGVASHIDNYQPPEPVTVAQPK